MADTYRDAALHMLITAKWACRPKSSAPMRLLVIHAIELYLNAYLLAAGSSPEQIRGLQHDLAKRAQMISSAGIILRRKTIKHLKSLSANREYVASRYGAPDASSWSQMNRLQATMDEVRSKTLKKLSIPVSAKKPAAAA